MTPPPDRPVARFALVFAVGAAVFLALDAVWLTTMADRLYRPAIGHLMRESYDVTAALAFYVVYLTGSSVFAVLPSRSAPTALARGAFFGFVAYATYDLTNQATLRDWPWLLTLADLCWGSVVTAASAVCAHAARAHFERRRR